MLTTPPVRKFRALRIGVGRGWMVGKEYKEYKETRAKLLLRGGYFDSSEELCRTCVSTNTRTLMLGHNHAQALASQETLAKLVKLPSSLGSNNLLQKAWLSITLI